MRQICIAPNITKNLKSKKMKTGIILTAFNLVHAGQAKMFEEAKFYSDYLLVGLQTDPTFNRPTKNKPT